MVVVVKCGFGHGSWVTVVVVVSPCSLPLLFPSCCPLLPPHEQMLVAAVEGAVVVAVVAVFPSPHSWLVVVPFSSPLLVLLSISFLNPPSKQLLAAVEGGASHPCHRCCWHHHSGVPPCTCNLPLSALSMAVSTYDPPLRAVACSSGGRCWVIRWFLAVSRGGWSLVVMWWENRVGGCLPCRYPDAQPSQHLPGVILAPNKPLTSHFGWGGGVVHC